MTLEMNNIEAAARSFRVQKRRTGKSIGNIQVIVDLDLSFLFEKKFFTGDSKVEDDGK